MFPATRLSMSGFRTCDLTKNIWTQQCQLAKCFFHCFSDCFCHYSSSPLCYSNNHMAPFYRIKGLRSDFFYISGARNHLIEYSTNIAICIGVALPIWSIFNLFRLNKICQSFPPVRKPFIEKPQWQCLFSK